MSLRDQIKEEFFKGVQALGGQPWGTGSHHKINFGNEIIEIYINNKRPGELQPGIFERVYPFVIVVPESYIVEMSLIKEFEDNVFDMFDLLMKIFQDIRSSDTDEIWVCDTDVLNWNITFGCARDHTEVPMSNNFPIQDSNGNMLLFIYVELNDYMS